MKILYNFQHKCPSITDYELYLTNAGNYEFMEAFNKHLDTCELCHEAIEGFKQNNIANISAITKPLTKQFLKKAEVINKFKLAGIAATIILLIGLTSIYFLNQTQSVLRSPDLAFNYDLLIDNSQNNNKTIAHKSTEQFIYIGSCNKIAYNDQFLTADELRNNLLKQKNLSQITVEVATDNYECANQIIATIKNTSVAPVITFSKLGGIKKLTSWEGM